MSTTALHFLFSTHVVLYFGICDIVMKNNSLVVD